MTFKIVMELKWLKNKLHLHPDRLICNFNEVNCFSDGPQCESKEVRSCKTFPNKCNNILSNNVHLFPLQRPKQKPFSETKIWNNGLIFWFLRNWRWGGGCGAEETTRRC